MSTTLSETKKNGFITLSNGDLTALGTQTAGLNAVGLGSANSLILPGMAIYCEFTINAVDVPDGSQPGIGLGNTNTGIADSQYLGIDPNSLANYSGAVFLNNAQIATIPGYSLGDVVGMATKRSLDGLTNLVWFRNQGGFAWNGGGTADPATGVGGIDITSLGDVFPAYNVKGTEQLTVNFGATALAFAAPAGFTTFDSIPAPPVVVTSIGGGWHHIGRHTRDELFPEEEAVTEATTEALPVKPPSRKMRKRIAAAAKQPAAPPVDDEEEEAMMIGLAA